jgi:cytochrome P450 family 3 subfamily A
MLLLVLSALLTLLLTKWGLERRAKFRILADYGYNVPPINYIFGNIHQIAKDDLGTMMDWIERCACLPPLRPRYGQPVGEKGGKIMGWYRGPNPALWTNSPELLKEIFIKDAESFIDRPMLDRTDNIPHLINMKVSGRVMARGATAPQGKDWKRARSTLAPTFSAAKMKKMSGIMGSTIGCHRSSLTTLTRCQDDAGAAGEAGGPGGGH